MIVKNCVDLTYSPESTKGGLLLCVEARRACARIHKIRLNDCARRANIYFDLFFLTFYSKKKGVNCQKNCEATELSLIIINTPIVTVYAKCSARIIM